MSRRGAWLAALLLLAATAGSAWAQGSGLPQRAPEPRTMRDFWPVFLAFAGTWAALVGYLLHVGRRIGRVAREAGALRGGE